MSDANVRCCVDFNSFEAELIVNFDFEHDHYRDECGDHVHEVSAKIGTMCVGLKLMDRNEVIALIGIDEVRRIEANAADELYERAKDGELYAA